MFQVIIPIAGEAQNTQVLRQFRIVNDHFGSFDFSTATGTITQAFTVVSSDSATTQTLPSALDSLSRPFTIKNRGAGVVTVAPLSGQTIDCKSGVHLEKNCCVSLMSDGSNWVVLFLLSAAYS